MASRLLRQQPVYLTSDGTVLRNDIRIQRAVRDRNDRNRRRRNAAM